MEREEKLKFIEELGISEGDYDELYKECVQDMIKKLSELNKAIERDNLVEAGKAVHSLKGLSGNYGIKSVYDISASIDIDIKNKSNKGEIENKIRSLGKVIEIIKKKT